jgi:hypothetical protein
MIIVALEAVFGGGCSPGAALDKRIVEKEKRGCEDLLIKKGK